MTIDLHTYIYEIDKVVPVETISQLISSYIIPDIRGRVTKCPRLPDHIQLPGVPNTYVTLDRSTTIFVGIHMFRFGRGCGPHPHNLWKKRPYNHGSELVAPASNTSTSRDTIDKLFLLKFNPLTGKILQYCIIYEFGRVFHTVDHLIKAIPCSNDHEIMILGQTRRLTIETSDLSTRDNTQLNFSSYISFPSLYSHFSMYLTEPRICIINPPEIVLPEIIIIDLNPLVTEPVRVGILREDSSSSSKNVVCKDHNRIVSINNDRLQIGNLSDLVKLINEPRNARFFRYSYLDRRRIDFNDSNNTILNRRIPSITSLNIMTISIQSWEITPFIHSINLTRIGII